MGQADGGSDSYIYALKYRWLTPIYDPLVRLTTREGSVKRRLIAQAQLTPGQRVLDVGCGTGTLLLLIKRLYPQVEGAGLDGDADVLAIARRKSVAFGVRLALEKGMSFALPYPDASFDHIFSSLLLHHLTRADKVRTLAEMRRVVRPGGQVHLADFGKPQDCLMQLATIPWRLFDSPTTTADNVRGRLPYFMRDVGFVDVREQTRYRTLFGTLSLYGGRRPIQKHVDTC